MCNLYSVKKSGAEIAAFFGITGVVAASNTPEETVPGYPGLVLHEQDGARVVEAMTWGFPLRLKHMKPDSKPKPVNNIADIRKPMWIGLARKPQWRCLIPVTQFAEAEGLEGRKTRTWFTVKDEPIFAWGGLWRITDAGGKVYSGAMTEGNEAIRPVHNRMPVLLQRDEWEIWLRGSLEDCCALQDRTFPADLIEMNRTSELWSKTSKAAKQLADGSTLI